MNRLATPPISPSFPSPSFDVEFSIPPAKASYFGDERAERAARPSCRPAAFCPLHYERGYAYPLIVWLHSEGGTEQELRRVMPRISLRNYVGVGPRGTQATTSPEAGCTWSQQVDQVELAVERVYESIDFVRSQLSIAAERIFIGGCGAGGTMALRIAFEHPSLFAGAISLDGLLPHAGQPLRRLSEIREMPLLFSMRMDSSTYEESALCRDLRLLHTAGMSVSLRHYRASEKGSESLLPLMLADVDRWIMDLICGHSDPADLE